MFFFMFFFSRFLVLSFQVSDNLSADLSTIIALLLKSANEAVREKVSFLFVALLSHFKHLIYHEFFYETNC